MLVTVFASAEYINDALYISPLYTDPVQSSTVFSNPAEMAHWNNIGGLEMRYRGRQNSFSGTLTGKTPDFFLGNFALSMEAFGSDFGSNLIWLPATTVTDGHFSLTKGGQKYTFTWAKQLEQATFGIDAKYYSYRELDSGREESGVGFDAGFLYHPFAKILYLGVVVNDLRSTDIYDSNKNLLYSIPERIRLTAAFAPIEDLSFTVGAPVDIFSDRLDARDTWRKMSFSVRKIWDKGLNADLGYNSRDVYASLGYIISDAVNLKAIISNDLSLQDGKYDVLFMVSAVLPVRAWTSISQGLRRTQQIIVTDKPKNQPWDLLTNLWLGINDNLITESIYLDYLDPQTARDMVKDMLSTDGRIEIDNLRKRLIISDFKDKVSDILEAVRRLDARAGRDWQLKRDQLRQEQNIPIRTDEPAPINSLPKGYNNNSNGPIPGGPIQEAPVPGRGFF
jgi:hypothetical protein